MTDSIDEEDVARIDAAVDPTALAGDEIEDRLSENPNLSGSAVSAFKDRVSEKREGIADEARSLLRKRVSPNPANPEIIQVRKADGTLGPKVPKGGAGRVDLDMNDRGEVTVTLEGEQVDLGRVDLQQDASGYRRERTRYSTQRHPAQQGGR